MDKGQLLWKKRDGTKFYSRADLYHKKLYEGKGYICMTPARPISKHSIVNEAHKVHDQTPSLAKAVMYVMEKRDQWEGTATELLSSFGWGWGGIPTISNKLSNELLQTYITDVLKDQDIKIERKRLHGGKRVLDIRRIVR